MLGFRITSHAAGQQIAESEDEDMQPGPATGRRRQHTWVKLLFVGIIVMLVLLVLAGGVAFSIFMLLPAHVPGVVANANKTESRTFPRLPNLMPVARSGKPNIKEKVRIKPTYCRDDPPVIKGLRWDWNGRSRHAGIVVNYKCPNNIEDVVVKKVVCRQGFWFLSTLRPIEKCAQVYTGVQCEESPPWPINVTVWDWDGYSKDVDVTIKYRCHKDVDSPVFKEIKCSSKGIWEVYWKFAVEEACSCSSPPDFHNPGIAMDGSPSDTSIGTVINYVCRNAKGGHVFQRIECTPQLDWLVTGKGSCLYLVDQPMTFSEANAFCTESGAELHHVTTDAEQNELVAFLREQPALNATCRHKVFLGIIEDTTQQWTFEDGSPMIVSSDVWDSMDSGRKKCVIMHSPSNFKLRNAFCENDHYCHVCEINGTMENSEETGCSAGQVCYLTGKEIGDYRFASFQCNSYGGLLARIKDKDTYNLVVATLEAAQEALGKCESFYVGARNQKRVYNTGSGNPVTFTKFVEDSARTLSRHCVVIHEFVRYQWTDENCSSQSCFVCKKTGYEVGSLLSLDRIASHRSKGGVTHRHWKPKDEDSRILSCPKDWKAHGFHCFFFNGTKVSHIEADASCRQFPGAELASMSIPFERNFILEQLLGQWDPDTHKEWHVESIAGLPQISDDLPPPIHRPEYEDDDLYVYSDELEEHESQNDTGDNMLESRLYSEQNVPELWGFDSLFGFLKRTKPATRLHLCVVIQLTPIPAWTRKNCSDKASFICHM